MRLRISIISVCLFGFFGILLALPAAAVVSVLVRFAYERYLAEHPPPPELDEELAEDDKP